MDLHKAIVANLVQERAALSDDDSYAHYVGRHRRFAEFMYLYEKYIDIPAVSHEVGLMFRAKLKEFQKTPCLDRSIRGVQLHELELDVYGHCADYFQTISVSV